MKFNLFRQFFLIIILAGFSRVFGQVKEYYLTCNPDDFAFIYANYEEDIFIPVTFTHAGQTWTDVKMRIRGDGSRMFPKKSLKVKFYGDPFSNGRKELNFNAEYEDKTYIRAFLSSQIFTKAGQICFATEHARLYLNGEFLGLYNRTENVDEQFLEAHEMDPDGNLFKAAKDGACLSVYDDLLNFWEQKTGEGNRQDLEQFINGINAVSIEDYPEFVSTNMDYSQVVNIIACNMVTSNYSTYYHNYYMYHDCNNTEKWQMLPWDLDKTLSVYSWKNHTNSSADWVPDNPFLEKAILNAGMLEDIKERANEIFNEVFRPDIFWPMIDSLVLVLQSSVAQDTTDNVQNVEEWLEKVQIEKNHFLNFPGRLNWYFDFVQTSFTAERTPGIHPQEVTFTWTPSVAPPGFSVYYRFLLTTGNQFEPDLTQIFDNIQDTFLTLHTIPEDDYFWKVISIGAGEQEVEAFDSKNPLKVKIVEELPCSITEDMILTADNSPYLVTCNITVEPQATLTILEGVTLLFSPGTHLKVTGGFSVQGTWQHPVELLPADAESSFDSLVFIQPQKDIVMNYMVLKDAVIHAESANLTLNHCELILQNKQLVYQNVIYGHYYGNGVFSNNRVTGNASGQGLEYGWCDKVIIENSHFTDIDDPMELISVNNGYVRKNYACNSDDDGIDFNNCKNLVIEENQLFNCNDNGVTIGNEFNGPCENIIISKNLIVNCNIGITVKDGSSAVSSGNTLYANQTGIKLWEKNNGLGGGVLDVENTIISATIGLVTDIDELSDCVIAYTLCDSELLEGIGNLYADPAFISTNASNFQLQHQSPCIDAGNPSVNPDPDGTIADIGAFFYNQGSFQIIINEINYKSSTSYETGDWVELYNPDSIPANLSGWVFKDEKDDHIFNFPYGIIMQPSTYLVLCNDAALFVERHPQVNNFIGDFDFGLSSSGETVRLFNRLGDLMDYVQYDVMSPWPEEPNGQGSSLELKSPWLDNSMPENWCASVLHGTPDTLNSCGYFSVELPESNFCDFAVFPNPAVGKFSVSADCPANGRITIQVYGVDGRLVNQFQSSVSGAEIKVFEIQQPGAKGIYLVRIIFSNETGSSSATKKILIN
ncbi:MAG TPA: CotH kinase family protein [Bacteroidales bacterium]|nr:CotH kinase family protein [Bacteroidales bacterium]